MKKERLGINFSTDWAHTPVARIVRGIGVWSFMKPAIKIYGSPTVSGTENLSEIEQPVIFVANHHSHSDTTLLLATIPPRFRRNLAIAAGADYFFPNLVAATTSALFIGAIPIERQKISKRSVKNALDQLEMGRNLLVFPSGSRRPEGDLSDHKPGAAFISTRTQVPMVPIYLYGTGVVLPKGDNWPTRSQCGVVFGKPIFPTPESDPRHLAQEAQDAIEKLAASVTKDP